MQYAFQNRRVAHYNAQTAMPVYIQMNEIKAPEKQSEDYENIVPGFNGDPWKELLGLPVSDSRSKHDEGQVPTKDIPKEMR